MKDDVTVVIKDIKKLNDYLPGQVIFFDEDDNKYRINIFGKLIIHK